MEKYRTDWNNAYTKTPPIPLNIDLELASTCNLRCPFCFIPDPNFEKFISQKSDDGKPLRRLMPKEMAFKVIDQCVDIGVPALKFNWRGESTLHPDYSEIVNHAAWWLNPKLSFPLPAKPFKEILANTNANCSDKAIDGLMATTKCMVSLDSMVPETYIQMRVGGKLDRAKEVISKLVKRGHPNLWIRRVLTKLNYKEDFFGQVKAKWGEKVKVSQHYCFDRNKKESHHVSGCDHDNETKRKYCGYPSQRLVVTSRGFVYPCCIDLKETLYVGDVNKESLRDIWKGEKIKALRDNLRSLKHDDWHETCRNCESWMSWDAPERNFVQDIQMLEAEGVKQI